MSFPESSRVVYKRNPLIEVICQLRFPTILRINTEGVANFQDKVRREYPLYEVKEPTIELLNAPKELTSIIEKLPFPIPAGATTHKFLTKDKRRLISLSQDFLAISETNYQIWELFKGEIQKAEESLRELFNPSFYSRVGLRYKDLIKPQELGLADKKWSELLSANVLGELGDRYIADTIIETKTRTIIKLEEIPGAQVTLIHGLVREKGSSENPSYLFDADFALEKTEVTDGTLDILGKFNRLAGRLFRWAISESLHRAMEPEIL